MLLSGAMLLPLGISNQLVTANGSVFGAGRDPFAAACDFAARAGGVPACVSACCASAVPAVSSPAAKYMVARSGKYVIP